MSEPTYYLPPVASGAPLLDTVHHCDALTLMEALPNASVDMILADLPYGTTACVWDSIIPFEPLWTQLKRVIKSRGAIVLTASQPFTSALVMSNPAWFRHEWIWEKSLATGYLNANKAPMKAHESVLIFSEAQANYYPVMRRGQPYRATRGAVGGIIQDKTVGGFVTVNSGERYPRSVIQFDSEHNTVHPTQKPVALFSYLIRTYTQPGDIVLDPVVGSGTTAIAARQTNRRFICGDSDAGYVEIARKRLAQPFTMDMFDHGVPESEAV